MNPKLVNPIRPRTPFQVQNLSRSLFQDFEPDLVQNPSWGSESRPLFSLSGSESRPDLCFGFRISPRSLFRVQDLARSLFQVNEPDLVPTPVLGSESRPPFRVQNL